MQGTRKFLRPHLASDIFEITLLNRERWAQVGIVVQFLALIRTLGDIFRLQYVRGDALQVTDTHPFVVGATVAEACCRGP